MIEFCLLTIVFTVKTTQDGLKFILYGKSPISHIRVFILRLTVGRVFGKPEQFVFQNVKSSFYNSFFFVHLLHIQIRIK